MLGILEVFIKGIDQSFYYELNYEVRLSVSLITCDNAGAVVAHIGT